MSSKRACLPFYKSDFMAGKGEIKIRVLCLVAGQGDILLTIEELHVSLRTLVHLDFFFTFF